MTNGGNFMNNNELYDFITKSRRQGKRETARKINVGTAYYEALDSPQGKILLKGYEDILNDKFGRIVNYRHDDKLTIEENYHNLVTHIVSYKAVEATGETWAGMLKGLNDAMKEVRKANSEI